MNNLLRTLTESQVKPSADLRLLLTSVKEGRKQGLEQKLTDGFYDSLEGLLNDLRTITIDNRDAEAFLRPVSRSEVPDYYDVIVTPMDLQTMLRKVKSKQYKSKREFQDDLDLIWSNCYTYNAAENHPLRRCVDRLKVKAEKLLKYITDRKERSDPPIPSNLPASSSTAGIARPRMTNGLNGHLNGYGSHSRSSSITSKPNTPTSSTFFGAGAGGSVGKYGGGLAAKKMMMGADVSFAEMPALVRSQEGMRLFRDLEEALDADQDLEGVLTQRLRALAPLLECEDDSPNAGDVVTKTEDGMDVDEGTVGEKRKQNGFTDKRPKKRAKLVNPYPAPLSDEKDDITQLWWAAIQSDTLIANTLPAIPFGPSSSSPRKPKKKKVKEPVASTSAGGAAAVGFSASPTKGRKTIKKEQDDSSLPALFTPPPTAPPLSASTSSQPQQPSQPTAGPSNPKSILALMNNNIKTMRRVRHTHTKFLALNATTAAAEEEEGAPGAGLGGGTGMDQGLDGSLGPPPLGADGSSMTRFSSPSAAHFAALDDEVVNDRIDESPWRIGRGRGHGHVKSKRRKGKHKMEVDDDGLGVGSSANGNASGSGIPVSGIELGDENANDCMHWAGSKILEHVGFQGTSKVALDVFADLTASYLQNVGRTMRFLTDKFGQTMTPEEIILHTLFESGTSKVQDLERFISDDVERYGNRLGELEKKLVNAYREATAGEILEDEGLFEEEDEDEVGALATGEFADFVGDDFFGLGELGIAAELGLSALTVPKRLLKGKKGANKPTAAKPTEPPPPYPPPPPFVPLTAAKVEDQIGLLQPFYMERFKTLAAATPPAPPPLPIAATLPSLPGPVLPPLAGPMIPGISAPPLVAPAPVQPPEPSLPPNTLPSTSDIGPPPPPPPPPPPIIPPDLVLPDDAPTTAQMKMGPIGQISRGSGGGTAGKKKLGEDKGSGKKSTGPSAVPSTPKSNGKLPPVVTASA